MAAHQALPSLGFFRQEHWSGLPFPPPMHESEKWKWSHSSCPTLSDPMDCSLPGSSVHGISRQEYWSGMPLQYKTRYYKTFIGNYRQNILWLKLQQYLLLSHILEQWNKNNNEEMRPNYIIRFAQQRKSETNRTLKTQNGRKYIQMIETIWD